MALTPAQFASTTFDYLIAGGGTAGLTLAARLSENPKIQVGVIEAGKDTTEDPLVLNPSFTLALWDNPDYDWSFKSAPQTHASGRVVGLPRGKALGGSSAINFYYWTHASQQDINDWGALGNVGWSWKSLFPYFLKSETYHPPTSQRQIEEQHTQFIDPALHGTNGPVQTSFRTYCSDWCKAWYPTFEKLGLAADGDPKGGLAVGAYDTLYNLDVPSQNRSWAATAYYSPNKQRKNLKVLTSACVTKINFSPGLEADTLDFIAEDGQSYTTKKVRKEIILSTGSYQTPQLLELSGIGDQTILKPLGIKTLLQNAAVGSNLQDHLLVPLSFEAADGEPTLDIFGRDPKAFEAAVEQAAVNHTGILATGAPEAYLSIEQVLKILNANSLPQGLNGAAGSRLLTSSTMSKADKLTIAKTLSPHEASYQLVFIPGGTTPSNSSFPPALLSSNPVLAPGNYVTIIVVLTHPFSRGTVHITSPNITDKPVVDPNYLADPKDLAVISAGVLAAQELATKPPLSKFLKNGGKVLEPGFPASITPKNVADMVESSFSSEYHPIGTTAMLPRGEGGVVDERFRVYGTKKLRVVDAGVFPLHVRGNIQSLVYAVAERAADMIKEDGHSGSA